VYESDVCAASNLISDGWAEDREHSGKARRTTATRHAAWGSKAVLILIGIRLGLDGVNPIYHESVKVRNGKFSRPFQLTFGRCCSPSLSLSVSRADDLHLHTTS